MESAELTSRLAAIMEGPGELESRFDQGLNLVAEAFEARTSTLHRTVKEPEQLILVTAYGLPDAVRELTRVIPKGKGMAGICWERGESVQVCNLQTDDSGVVRPGARETQVAGAIVVPVKSGDSVVATLGVGKAGDYEYSPEEIACLETCGAIFARAL